MFDLIAGNDARPLREASFTSKLLALVAHLLVISTVVALTLLHATNQLPELRTIRAFVVEAPPPPPPPPPPPAPQASAVLPKAPAQPVPAIGSVVAPVAAPDVIVPEPLTARNESVGGVAGGVEGGVPGGVIGGIVGGIVSVAPPPPPPPPPAPPAASAPRAPVRIGGQITAPALLHRVEPVYPDFASFARLSGMVILEAVVNTEGCVESVKILRTRHPLLDKAAADALLQWRYSPLILNGVPSSFVLTVTFNFNVQK